MVSKTNTTKPYLKLLFIGRTGAGKTTLINMITNLFERKTYFDKRLISITQTFTQNNQNDPNNQSFLKLECTFNEFENKQSDGNKKVSESQTEWCNIYTFENSQLKLSLIDTPGLGDTRGPEQDKKNIKEIVIGISKVSDFNAICLVQKQNDARKDDLLKYLIAELRGMLTKECENNFIICFTGVINSEKIDAIHALNEIQIPTKNQVYFENDCLIPSSDKKKKKIAEVFWQENQENFDELIKMSLEMMPIKSSDIKELHSKKTVLTNLIYKELNNVENLSNEQLALKRSLNEIDLQISEMKKHSNFEYTDTEVDYYDDEISYKKIVEVDISPNKITQCCNCNSKCHNPCNLDGVLSRGDINLKGCAAFSNNETCKVCGHSIDVHTHTQKEKREENATRSIKKPSIRTVTKVDSNKKNIYSQAENKKNSLSSYVMEQERSIKQLQLNLNKAYRKIAFIFNEIKSKSLSHINEYFLDYIEVRENAIKSNEKLNSKELENELKEIDKCRKEYQMKKEALGKDGKLEADELKELEILVKEIELEEQKLFSK